MEKEYFDENVAQFVLLVFALCSDIYHDTKPQNYYGLQPKCNNFTAVIKYILDKYAALEPGYHVTHRYDATPRGCRVVCVNPDVLNNVSQLPNVQQFRDMFQQRFDMPKQTWQPKVAKLVRAKAVPGFFALRSGRVKDAFVEHAIQTMGFDINAERKKFLDAKNTNPGR